MRTSVQGLAAYRDDLERASGSRPFRFAFVSNSAEVGDTLRAHCDTVTEQITFRYASMEAAVVVARELLANGTEVIIGGNGTGRLLAQEIGQPVVKLERDYLDVLLALVKAREISSEVGLTSFRQPVDGVEAYERLLGMRITPIVFASTQELAKGIGAAAKRGCGIIVGGGICRQTAVSLGLPGIVVVPRASAAVQTLKEARALAVARRKERGDFQQLRTILETSKDGVIVLDPNGRVKFMNSAAADVMRPILSATGASIIGEPLPVALTPMGMLEVLETGEAQLDRVRRIGTTDIVVSSSPIHVDGEVVGVVSMFREATRIQNIDRRVREKLYTKGFIAKYSFRHMRGGDPAMRKLIEKARRFARSDAAVLIEGETGTGKELLAQSIHNESKRSEGPFLAVNCSALSDSLLESELFGYEEGAFTGARRRGKIGLFELANGGTLFLDEIADVSPALQLRLLRVIEEKEIMRIAGDRMVPVDVRAISSSQSDLGSQAAEHGFRRDLYYRLATLRLRIPPLRDRVSDIPALTRGLFEKYGAEVGEVSARVWAMLGEHTWPGNIRELDSLVRTYLALTEGVEFSEDLFLEVFAQLNRFTGEHTEVGKVDEPALKCQLRRVERDIILRTLKECGMNRGEAARRLGISLNSLWRKTRGEG